MAGVDTYKNRYSGRIFLIGNGPSLEKTPLQKLRNEVTFAVNGISKIFDQTDWRPTFYTAVDRNVRKNEIRSVINEGIECFLPRYFKNEFGERDNIVYLDTIYARKLPFSDISRLNIDFDNINIEMSFLQTYPSACTPIAP